MSGRYLLDTNVIIALFAREQTVLDRLAAADAVFVPIVALGELYYGARKSGRVEQNLERLDDFAAAATLLDCNQGTAQRYGEIKNGLRAKGHPIPENDIWIGAAAMQHDLTVATRDDDHFSQISGLRFEVMVRRHPIRPPLSRRRGGSATGAGGARGKQTRRAR